MYHTFFYFLVTFVVSHSYPLSSLSSYSPVLSHVPLVFGLSLLSPFIHFIHLPPSISSLIFTVSPSFPSSLSLSLSHTHTHHHHNGLSHNVAFLVTQLLYQSYPPTVSLYISISPYLSLYLYSSLSLFLPLCLLFPLYLSLTSTTSYHTTLSLTLSPLHAIIYL